VFKLYVSALTTLNLDDHNRIPTSDVRLLRRLVRDYLTRGATIERTLNMWDSVQRGEQRWIFPYQEGADAIFNTALVYELAVLKRHIFPLLQSVDPTSPCYDQVRNIVKFLNYVQDASVEDEIPPTSILREFIGGNTFYLKREAETYA
jgi:uridine kinase